MISDIDSVRLNFSPESLQFLNVLLGVIMYVVALALHPADFVRLARNPRSVGAGILAQFVVLPALTCLLAYLWQPAPSLALGMVLVAACPGGNVSNLLSLLARGNVALSVSLTAFATLAAIFFTPLNFAFWSGLLPDTAQLRTQVQLNAWDMMESVALLLGLPLVLGMATRHYFPKLADRIMRPGRIVAIVIFSGFIVGALAVNWEHFLTFLPLIFFLVMCHNALALGTGFGLASLFRLPHPERRTLTLETGIQNSGLGLLLILNFFDGIGGMMIITAWWGVWHLLAGITTAMLFRTRSVAAYPVP